MRWLGDGLMNIPQFKSYVHTLGLSFPHAKPGRIHPLFSLPLSLDHFSLMLDTGRSGGGLALD